MIFYDDYHDHDHAPVTDFYKSDFKKIYKECDSVTNKITHMPTKYIVSELSAKLTGEIERLNRVIDLRAAVAFEALASTPAQSLQSHDDEVIERCAREADARFIENCQYNGNFIAIKIRELKGKPCHTS